MLILTRRLSEALCIGEDIKVTILAVNGNQVRLGIDAPREVPVHREEVAERINEARLAKMHLEMAAPADQVRFWNESYPKGTPVDYTPEPGADPIRTTTLSAAQLLRGETPVVWLDGISGGVALRNCTARH